jgi:hypothetical protein
MRKTLISHFYNEEYLLPWFLNHHKKIFDHGIMIDYHSTDSSCDIIRTICPDWEIIKSKNQYFDPQPVDNEVVEIESRIDGWKICLNVTEQIIGNYEIMTTDGGQHLLPNFFFVDLTREEELDYSIPLYYQKKDGFAFFDNNGSLFSERCSRSIHTGTVSYPGAGRHFTHYTTDELVIFYYGWCPFNEKAINRKLGMSVKVPEWISSGRHHTFPREWMEERHKNDFLPKTRNLENDIQKYIDIHNRLTEK